MDVRDSLMRTVERLMGQRRSAGICRALAMIGLRGLGVNVHYDLDGSGEAFFLSRFFRVYPGSVSFDIGANVGDYSAALIRCGAKNVVAFEPTPSTYQVLLKRLSNEGAVQIVNMAIGETIGTVDFDIPQSSEQSTLASRDLGLTEIGSSTYAKTRVPITTLDAFVDNSKKYPDFVKIDVEGFELEVLLGMNELLSVRPPKAIQFEFNQHHLKRRQNLSDFSALLKDFMLFRLAARSMRPLDPSHYLSNIFTYSNIVAVHKNCVPSLSKHLC